MITSALALVAALTLMPPAPETATQVRQRFPSQEVFKEACTFNRLFRTQCEAQLAACALDSNPARREFWEEAIKETDELYRAWVYLCVFPGEHPCEAYWEKWLAKLREQIGEPAFAAGQMPPCVPVWRFTPVR